MTTVAIASSSPLPMDTSLQVDRHEEVLSRQRLSTDERPVLRSSPPATRPAENPPGGPVEERCIKNYVIGRKTLGAGSMGKVKLAEYLVDGVRQKCAVKIIPKIEWDACSHEAPKEDPKNTPKEREQRTLREMAMMRLLKHPNICELKEWITEGENHYMFLEYVDGGQLLDYIVRNGKLREKLARKFARQIVSALDYCHRNSIVHRDLKIENILITKSENIKIIDFGLSNTYSPTNLLSTFCGSLYFAAPELLSAKHYTGPEVDVWSFGVVLYVLVCGRVPFDDSNIPALHAKIKSGTVDHYPDHLSKDCVDLLSRLLTVDPARRATLSAIQRHPWMTKGYDEPIQNYLPHRQPLQSVDMEVVRGMEGFGLGKPDTIAERLNSILASHEYQQASLRVDQNYQLNISHQARQFVRPRWRKSLSGRKSVQDTDDPISLPAMYDPLVSVYYLVKENIESKEHSWRTLKRGTTLSMPQLSRSSPTVVQGSGILSSIPRRKSTHIAGVAKLEPPTETTPLPPSLAEKESVQLGSTPKRHSSSALLGHMSPGPFASQKSRSSPSAKRASASPASSSQELAGGQEKRKSARSRSSWGYLSIRRKPSSADSGNDAGVASNQGQISLQEAKPWFVEGETTIPMTTPPKSILRFGQAHLFKDTAPQFLHRVMDTLWKMNIRVEQIVDQPFAFLCSCDRESWKYWDGLETDTLNPLHALKFIVIIYQARWMGGKYGVKVRVLGDESDTSHSRASAALHRIILQYLSDA